MAYKMTIVVTLESDEGAMSDQTTVWYSMDYPEMLKL